MDVPKLTLKNLRDWLLPELELLVQRPENTKPFLVVTEVVTGQFFQFAGSEKYLTLCPENPGNSIPSRSTVSAC